MLVLLETNLEGDPFIATAWKCRCHKVLARIFAQVLDKRENKFNRKIEQHLTGEHLEQNLAVCFTTVVALTTPCSYRLIRLLVDAVQKQFEITDRRKVIP